MKINKKNKKALSAGLAVAILVTGTFAWQSFNQTATNKTSGDALTEEPGARLHDDFDGDNKDVYVENFTSLDYGVDVYARIRLDEYFEYGVGVADSSATGRSVTVLEGDIVKLDNTEPDNVFEKTPDIDDVDSWYTYSFGSKANGKGADANGEENIRTYRDLAFGGSTSYLPTFNKDIHSKDADINGTYEVMDLDGNRYDDYVDYILGQPIEDTATVMVYPTDEDETETKTVTEEHIVSKTESATVISMSEWKSLGSPVGNYWVYDVDGWAYYAKGISPQTASGLLLDNIQVITDPGFEWFYAVNVVAQIADAGNWGDAESTDVDEQGMYADSFSEDGQLVLNTASGNTAITNVSITKAGGLTLTTDELNVALGSSLSLAANVSVYNGSGAASESEVVWTIEVKSGFATAADAEAALSATGTFAPTETILSGGEYIITATSKFDAKKSDSAYVTVK